VRSALTPLVKLAGERGFAIINVTHLNKSNGAAMYRTMGSLAFVAAARAAFVVARDKNDQTGERRLFLPLKNNIGNDKTGLAYCVVADHSGRPCIRWEDGAIETSADEALSADSPSHEANAKERRRHRTEAGWTAELLRALDDLARHHEDGCVPYSNVKAGAGLNSNNMGLAVRLLEGEGIIAVETKEYKLPHGGTKPRKALRRLRGGEYQGVDLAPLLRHRGELVPS
jgi:hypothetical protein